MIFCFRVKCLLLFGCCFVLSIGVGCNQQRYKPAKWRAAQRNAGENASAKGNSTMPDGAWSNLPERNSLGSLPLGSLPRRGGSTLPGRGWSSLPHRGMGMSLPHRGMGMSLPVRNGLRGGSSLPQRRWQVPPRGGDTMPRRRWQPMPRQSTMPARRYDI